MVLFAIALFILLFSFSGYSCKRSIESVRQGLDAHLVLTAYDQSVIEARKDRCDRTAGILERVMVEAGRDILDPVPVMVDIKVGKYWS